MGMNTASVQRLYVAYFNRQLIRQLGCLRAMLPTDRAATQADCKRLQRLISARPLVPDYFAGKSNAQIVDQLYQNIFGRTMSGRPHFVFVS